MLNIFRKPFEKESLDDWAKIVTDVNKVAVLSIPVVVYSENTTEMKALNIGLLLLVCYLMVAIGRVLRRKKQEIE